MSPAGVPVFSQRAPGASLPDQHSILFSKSSLNSEKIRQKRNHRIQAETKAGVTLDHAGLFSWTGFILLSPVIPAPLSGR